MRSCGFATLGKHSKTRGVPILPGFEVPIFPPTPYPAYGLTLVAVCGFFSGIEFIWYIS
jgi:hypothetical protein